MVGVALPLKIDLSAARPARSDDVPDSTLAVRVLSPDANNKAEPLVVWSTERTVTPMTESEMVELGPLSVAGELQLSVTLDGAECKDSPMALHVLRRLLSA